MSLAFLITSAAIVAIPGPGAMFTISAGLMRGRRASLIAAFGCTLGIVPHLVAAVTGTAALVKASGEAFQLLRIGGCAYLLFMAWSTWRDRTPLVIESDRASQSAWSVTRSAVTLNLLNPKLTLFFFAFLPQFVPQRSHHYSLNMLLLSSVFMSMTFVVFAAYGMAAASARRYLSERLQFVRRLRQAFALSFAGLAAKLASASR